MEESSGPSSPMTAVAVPMTRYLGNDSTTALGQQLTSIFANLSDAPDSRPMRIEECLGSLMDTLFAHAKEIGASEGLQDLLVALIGGMFETSTDKGCRSFQVVLDMKWKDQHEKRSRGMALLVRYALGTTTHEDCATIMKVVDEVLSENVRSTTDILDDHISPLLTVMTSSPTLSARASSCEILERFVATSAAVIKRNPTLLELLTASCSPSVLLQQAVESSHHWYRTALIRLLTTMVEQNCYEVSSQMALQTTEVVHGYMKTVTEEGQLVGVLSILSGIATSPSFAGAPWRMEEICRFLAERDWSVFSTETRCAAVHTTGRVSYHLVTSDNPLYEKMTDRLLKAVCLDDQEIVQQAMLVMSEMLHSERGLRRLSQCILALRACIERMPFMPLVFRLLEEIRARYSDADLSPIYNMVDEYMNMDQAKVNFGKLNALLHFMGKHAPLKREDVLKLTINVSPTRPEPVIIRCLSLLTTLERTNQLNDAVELLFHDDVGVRQAAINAVVSLSELLIRRTEESEQSTNYLVAAQRINSEVDYAVERLLDVAVTDRVPEIRFQVLHRLTPPFYPYLCLPDNLDALFMTRNDVNKDPRDQSLVLLCHLHPYHPAIVRPQLLRMQEYMLRDVEAPDASISLAIYRAGLLKLCADHDSLLLQPVTVEKAALQRLQQQSFQSKKLTTALLELIQSILKHSGPQYHCDGAAFVEPVLAIINGGDSSSQRCAAFETLSAVLTTFSISDMSTYVEVYRTIARAIRWAAEEEENALGIAAMKALSTIGAVNPVRIRRVLRAIEQDMVEEVEEVVTPAIMHHKPDLRIHPRMADRYPCVALYYLVKALLLSIDPRQQAETLVSVRCMLQEISGEQRAELLTQLLPQLQAWLRESEKAHMYESVLALMIDLAVLLRENKGIVPANTGNELLQSVQQFCSLPQASQKPLSAYVVQLLDDLAKGLPAQEMRDHRWAVEFIHQRLSQDKNDLDLVHCVVKSLESFLVVMHEKDIQLILPHVLQCIEPAKITPPARQAKMKEINASCFDFLNYVMVKQLSLVKECCAQIVHTIMWYIELSDNQVEMDVGLATLASLIDVVQLPARRFIMPVERVAEQNGYPKGYFVNLVASAANGTKLRVPQSHSERLNPEQPLSVLSQLPRLTAQDFVNEMKASLRFKDADFTVMDVGHPNGQSVVRFQFNSGENQGACFNLFMRKAQDVKSSLRRNLSIVKVEQSVGGLSAVDTNVIAIVAAIPTAKSKKREQSWISWLHNTSVLLLKNCPFPPLRTCFSIAERNSELSRDLFPFSVCAVVNALSPSDRSRLMTTFTSAVEKSPIDIKQTLYTVAEFLEAERVEQKVKLVDRTRQKVFVVERASPDLKFGINYDQDPARGVIVTKLAQNGLGAQAGVPVGSQLLAINGKTVHTVGDIRGMIEGLNRIDLTLCFIVTERVMPVPVPLMDLKTLATVAFESQMHAKAIYFNEVLFEQLRRDMSNTANRQDTAVREALSIAERLILFYGHLNLTMEANGLVKALTRQFAENIISSDRFGFDEIGTLEQLHWWNEALRRYEARLGTGAPGAPPHDISAFVGVLRCHEALGNLTTVNDLIAECWSRLDTAAKAEVAAHRARAAMTMGEWDKLDDMAANPVLMGKLGTVERCTALFRMGKYDQLLAFTRAKRDAALELFCESFNESYNRSYDGLVKQQHLTHFEELVSYTNSSPDRKAMLQQLWHRRLSQLSFKPANVRAVMTINSLVLTPQEDLSSQVLAIRSMTKAQWHGMAGLMLTRLLGDHVDKPTLCQQDPEVIHAYMKHLAATRNRHDAYRLLREILLEGDANCDDQNSEKWGMCWLLLGEWSMTLFPDRGEEAIDELMRATELSPRNYAAFHSLGILHYDLSRDPSTLQQVRITHYTSAVIALFQSVQLGSDYSRNVMQDVVRILSIWFTHSNVETVNEAVHQGMQTLPDHVWLDVIPQLIARIGIQAKLARAILADLLVRVGTMYPQALIYPLTVAEKSPEAIRRMMAERVLAGIRIGNKQMVEEASLISNEMVRIAILWTEKWHAAIQLAATKSDNAAAIQKILKKHFDELDHAVTPNERNFEKTFGQTLKRAKAALQERALDKAWPFLKQVYVQLNKMLGERRLLMSDVSPTLDTIRDSIVAVPGTFHHGKALITIQKFHPRVYVMPSKQKPRRFGLDASDGKKYRFLLKGHEDMRQDERVMQFIGLIDTIFLSDNTTTSIGLTIPQYAVIPLTDNVGIVGWVENTETIYKMLETHRQEHDVSIYEEVNMITKRGGLRNIEDYHRLPKPQRKDLLSYVMQASPDNELRSIVWERNDTCEQWLGYRGTYGLTLAAMSMVGYVLGLGDRHLNNLMLDDSGTVVHIDFGDCFEVAMHRALYAEAVPFRLTRLLVAALGLTGVDGVFRLTCELVMKNLRKHNENLLSILEAFIYDPLINWRLNANENEKSLSRREMPESVSGIKRTASKPNVLHDDGAAQAATAGEEAAPKFSRSFAKQHVPQQQGTKIGCTTITDAAGEETRNQQGDLALARVHAKLTGQDFNAVNVNGSFSLLRSSRAQEDESLLGNSWQSHSAGMSFGESPKEPGVSAPLLTTYLSLRVLTGGADCLDVPHQVDRLIHEATSLDNLAEAYLTGWAPFW